MNKKNRLLIVFTFVLFLGFNSLLAQNIPISQYFKNAVYYNQIFTSQDRNNLTEAELKAKDGEVARQEANELFKEADKYYAIADATDKKRFKRRAEKKAEEFALQGYEKFFFAYSLFQQSNKTIYDIYQSRLMQERRNASGENLVKAMQVENRVYGAFSIAHETRKQGDALADAERVAYYIRADSIELSYLDSIRKIFIIYRNDDFDNDPQARELEEAKMYASKLDSLLRSSTESPDWLQTTMDINSKIQELLRQKGAATTPEVAEMYNRQIAGLTGGLNGMIKEQIRAAEELNNQYYIEQTDRFANVVIKEADKNKQEVVRATLIKKACENNLYLAKLKIQEAYITENPTMASFLLAEADKLHKNALDSFNIAYKIFEEQKMIGSNVRTSTSNNSNRANNNARTATTPSNSSALDRLNIEFRVQIGAFRTPPPQGTFGSLTAITAEPTNQAGLNKYYVGKYKTYETAEITLAQVKGLSYTDAFIVAFENNLPVDVEYARKKVADALGTNYAASNAGGSNLLQPTFTNTIAQSNANKGKTVVAQKISQYSGLVYTVQVGFVKDVPLYDDFKLLSPIYSEVAANGTKYFAGLYSSAATARTQCTKIRSLGIADAFVVAYYNGASMNMESALLQEQGRQTAVGSNTTNVGNNSGIYFTVQVGAYKSDRVINDAVNDYKKYAGNNAVEQHGPDANKMVVITIGKFDKEADAQLLKSQIVALGLTDCFVIAYKGTQKLQVFEARELLRN